MATKFGIGDTVRLIGDPVGTIRYVRDIYTGCRNPSEQTYRLSGGCDVAYESTMRRTFAVLDGGAARKAGAR